MRIGPASINQIAPIAGEAPKRWSSAERTMVYLRVLSTPNGAAADVQAHQTFADLWLRFVATAAQFSPGDVNLANAWALVSRDFAAAAQPRIDAAWSERDMWNVMDQVSNAELGGASNAARHRSMAETGGAVLEWVLDQRDCVGEGPTPDRSLADAVAQWLALTVTPDDGVEAPAQPDAAAARLTEWSRALLSALGQPLNNNDKIETPRPLVALFEGVSGTGKTLAAHWLATSIGSAVQRVDLRHVVSKYVGETERNLDRVFGSARTSGAALLLDEADALLGKRTEVHDSNDRYANTETGLLLQRLERHDGVTILTTNAATCVDPSLRKRANVAVVAFPLPPR